MAKGATRDSDRDGPSINGPEMDRRVSSWLAWVWAGGGDVLCADGKRRQDVSIPRHDRGPELVRQLVTSRIAPRPRRTAGLRLLAGKVAMLTVGHSAIPQIRSRAAAGTVRVGFTTIPHRAGVTPVTVLCATGFAVPALALRRKLAVELVASLTDSLAGRLRGEAGLELPALSSVAAALAAGDTLGWEAAFRGSALHGRIPWEARVSRWGEVETALAGLMDSILEAPIRGAAHDMALQLDRLLGATR
jgi:hypothetical protein